MDKQRITELAETARKIRVGIDQKRHILALLIGGRRIQGRRYRRTI